MDYIVSTILDDLLIFNFAEEEYSENMFFKFNGDFVLELYKNGILTIDNYEDYDYGDTYNYLEKKYGHTITVDALINVLKRRPFSLKMTKEQQSSTRSWFSRRGDALKRQVLESRTNHIHGSSLTDFDINNGVNKVRGLLEEAEELFSIYDGDKTIRKLDKEYYFLNFVESGLPSIFGKFGDLEKRLKEIYKKVM